MNASQTDGIRRASQILGSQLALSKALAVTPVTVSQWMRPEAGNGRPVPPKQCVRIERITAGQVTRRELRPDDWQDIWPELAATLDEVEANQVHEVGTVASAQQGVAHG